jgi:hypothetical protein
MTLVSNGEWAAVARTHMTAIMLTVVVVYARRDLYPLVTYVLKPVDGSQGWLLWSRLGIASLLGTFIPLVIPRTYTPVDPLVSVHLSFINTILTLISSESRQRSKCGADSVMVVILVFHIHGSRHFYGGANATPHV